MTDDTTRPTELWRWDARATAQAVARREISSREATQAHLARLHAVNPALNAVVLTLADEALAAAGAADRAVAAGGPLGLLHGVPITTKITSDQKGCPSDNGVIFLKDNIAPDDSAVIANLRRAGAVILGRTNSPAFALRADTDNMLHGRTFNPWNRAVTPGGSSGGAGAALAAGIGAVAHGSDIGGSIRWPAFCNGVVGLRPTPGRVPAYNPSAAAHRAFASQLMAVNGPLARNVDDAELAFRAMAVPDPRDPHGVPAPLDGPDEGRILRVALFEAPAEAPVSDAATQAVRRTGEILSAAGFDVAYASPPDLARLEALWHLIALVELRAALEPLLARTRDRAVESFFRAWWAAKPAATLETYLAALQERDTLMRRWQVFMEDYPLVVLPSCPRDRLAAGRDAEGAGGAADAIDILRFQLPISVLGLPSLAVPVGTQDGLPQGVQIVSRRFREDFCFRAGRAIEAQEPPRTPIEPAA